MRIDIFDQAVELAANRSIVLHDAKAAEVVCTRGRVWITEDPLRNDVMLEAGESHVISVGGLAFVTGVTASTVWLREPLQSTAVRTVRGAGLAATIASAGARLLARWPEDLIRRMERRRAGAGRGQAVGSLATMRA